MLKQVLFSMMLTAGISQTIAQTNAVDYVNPIIGTNGMGHTFPGACVPFGIVQLSPDTDTIPHNIKGVYQKRTYEYCAGYQYSDSTIVGFSHTHLSGTGHSDLGDVLIMPVTGEVKLNPGRASNPDEGYRSRFNHDTEYATAGNYKVVLQDYNIKAELTATPHTGTHKYTFPINTDGHIILDMDHGIYNYDGKTLWTNIRVENDTLITGYRITNGWARTNYTYFAISLSQPIIDYGYIDKKKPLYQGFLRRFKIDKNYPEIAGRSVVSYFKFRTSKNPELVIKVAFSAVSCQGALKNLMAEANGKSFNEISKSATSLWQEALQHYSIDGNQDEKVMFYTSLYHTMINPSIYMDVDRQYRGIDHNIHKAEDFTNYTIFSLWDTYRAEHPFLNIMDHKRSADMVASMIAHQQQSVHHMLPVWSLMGNENWCMSGYHAVSVLADAIAKGIYKDSEKAIKAMVETSNVPYYDNMADYIRLGYVPYEKSGTAASVTLESSYDDWAIYITAKRMGNKDVADAYYKRALNYRNVFDPNTGFASPRYSDGTFKKDMDPLQTYDEGFIEGNSWNFSFHVPHDVFGMMNMMGGDAIFLKRLNTLFDIDLPAKYYEKNEDITKDGIIGGYVHGNEPSHHIPYLFAWTSQPWKTQYWIREIINRMYRNEINGLGGNDDCGQMSSWYMFSVMGFYPVCPGTDQYVLGAPYFKQLKVKLSNGKVLEIKAPEVSDKKRYVTSFKINGKQYDKMYITHDMLMQGGIWEFKMSSVPNKKRGIRLNEKPYSLTNINQK